MKNVNGESEVLRAADSGGVRHDVEIYIRDGDESIRTLIASGGFRQASFNRCSDHFIAHGICVDCTRARGRTVWAE
jgi:hypothetical protein